MTRRPPGARGGAVRKSAVGLTRDRIVAVAIAVADSEGIERLSMRRLATELGVDPMSIYHHVVDKDDLLATMADAVVAAIPSPAAHPATYWADSLRSLVLASRATMLSHPWAVDMLLTRSTPTPAALAHVERVLAILRGGGLSVALTHHALHILGSRILGFSQDLFDDSPDDRLDDAALGALAITHPYAAELAAAVSHRGELGGCDDGAEFAYGLDLLLEALERRRLTEGEQARQDN